MGSVLLLPVSPVDRGLVSRLAVTLHELLQFPVTVGREEIESAPAFDLSRNQYHSTAIILQIQHKYGAFDGKVLAVTGVDLFVPVLTYVFGEAQLDGRAAVVSTLRLDDALYGFPANQALYEQRLIKEAMHELGHTFGLYHCHNYNCVMHSSTAVEEIDLKGERFCRECEKMVTFERKPIPQP